MERNRKQEQHPRKKSLCRVPVARSAHSTPSLPWARMGLDCLAPAAESRAEGAACDPQLKAQAWRQALLTTFPPESSSPPASPQQAQGSGCAGRCSLQEQKASCVSSQAHTEQQPPRICGQTDPLPLVAAGIQSHGVETRSGSM